MASVCQWGENRVQGFEILTVILPPWGEVLAVHQLTVIFEDGFITFFM